MEEIDFEEIGGDMIPSNPNMLKLGTDYLSGNPNRIIKNITENINETIKFCEEQKTKREEIKARTQVYISQINAQRDFLINFLDRTFDERKQLFAEYFKLLDKGLEKGDTQTMSIALQQINQLSASSPFKSLESTQNYITGLLGGQNKLDF